MYEHCQLSENDSRCTDRWMLNQRPCHVFNLWSSCSSRPNQACRTASSSLPWPVVLPHRPHGLTILRLARPSLYSPTPPVILRQWRPYAVAETVNPHTPLYLGIHLPRLLWLLIVPFLCITIVHRLDALGASWSTRSTNDSHRKWTLGCDADSWTHQLHLRNHGSASLLLAK